MKEYRKSIFELVLIMLLTLFVFWLSSCSTTHSFSLNADSIESPQIVYSDSLKFQKLW